MTRSLIWVILLSTFFALFPILGYVAASLLVIYKWKHISFQFLDLILVTLLLLYATLRPFDIWIYKILILFLVGSMRFERALIPNPVVVFRLLIFSFYLVLLLVFLGLIPGNIYRFDSNLTNSNNTSFYILFFGYLSVLSTRKLTIFEIILTASALILLQSRSVLYLIFLLLFIPKKLRFWFGLVLVIFGNIVQEDIRKLIILEYLKGITRNHWSFGEQFEGYASLTAHLISKYEVIVHNEFLQLFYGLGLIGFSVYLLWYFRKWFSYSRMGLGFFVLMHFVFYNLHPGISNRYIFLILPVYAYAYGKEKDTFFR